MEHGLRLPWWEFRPADLALPGTVVPPDSRQEEGLLAGFLQAGARAETADCFVSANSLNVAGVLDALSQEELVLPAARSGSASCGSHQAPHRANLDSPELPQLGCRSRLFGMPLADRHAALTVACSLRHRLPRRALVNFFCRLILGKDIGRLPPSEAHDGRRDPPTEQTPPGACQRQGGGRGLCVCGGQLSSRRNARAALEIEGGSAETNARRFAPEVDAAAARGAAAAEAAAAEAAAVAAAAAAATVAPPPTACQLCLGRRAWLDPGSARLLVVACHKLLWDKALPEDEALALDRCLRALSELLGDRDQSRRSRSKREAEEPPAGDGGGGGGSSGGVLPVPPSAVPGGRVGVSAVRAGVRRRRIGFVTTNSSSVNNHDGRAGAGADSAQASAAAAAAAAAAASAGDAGSAPAGSVPRLPASPTTRGRKNSTGGRGVGSARAGETEPSSALADRSEEREAPGAGETAGGGGGVTPPPSPSGVAVIEEGGRAAGAPSRGGAPLAGGEEGNSTALDDNDGDRIDCLPSVLRQRVASVAEKVAAAGARGAASTDVQGAAAAAVSLLREATKLPSNTAPPPPPPPTTMAVGGSSSSSGGPFSERPRPPPQKQPLEAVCGGVGLDIPRGKGPTVTTGCGDDLVMAVCDGFVTPALSLRNCLAFVRAVFVPRARALTAPASRLLVTAVSGIGKARPGVVIDGLVLPLLCEGDPASPVGSAQCELCTRLIKQILPKDTLEAVLVGLCGPAEDESAQTAGGWIGGPNGGSGGNGSTAAAGRRHDAAGSSSRCVWTELTVPVMTTALNLKPALSDRAIAALVRGVEAAAERAALQKSLKFTTLIHSLVTRYGPQLKPHVPVLRAAVGRCSTFMVKAVLAALQRLEK